MELGLGVAGPFIWVECNATRNPEAKPKFRDDDDKTCVYACLLFLLSAVQPNTNH